MLSLLRKLIGCWHDWSKWRPVTIEYNNHGVLAGTTDKQFRACQKCGMKQIRSY